MLASLIALTLALLAGPVTIDEARLIAQEHAGTEMAPEPEIEELNGEPYLARFHPVDQERRGETHVVRLDTGRYRGSSSEHTPSPLAVLGPVTDETAIDIARAIAKERGAPRFDELIWRVDSMSDDYCAVITGEVPSPDRRFAGPLTGCRVGVLRADGSIIHYGVYEFEVPSFDDVRISGERAREIAVELLGPDTHVTVEPRLWYGPFGLDYSGAKRLAWRLKVGTPEYEEVLVEVDARTGEAGVMGYAVGTASSDAPVPVAPPRPSASPTAEPTTTSPPWALYGGIVLLCAIALGVFLLRRRRT
jgi:hypothetical protein